MAYKCVMQQDQTDCGAACLATVALHHGLAIGLQKMRDLAGTDKIGTNLWGLKLAAEKLGFSARGVKGPYEELPTISLPAIAHMITPEGLGHFVVIHKWTPNHVIVADPAKGVEKRDKERFTSEWTGYLLILAPSDRAFLPEIMSSHKSPWLRFWDLLQPNKAVLLEAFLSAIFMTALGLASSFFVQHLVDSVLVHGQRRLLNALSIGMLMVIGFRSLFGVFRHYLLVHISRRIDLSLISAYARHVLRLPMNFFEMRRVGEILSRVSDAAKIRSAISGTTLSILVDGTLVIVSAGIMFVYDWPLALVAFLFTPLLLFSVMIHHSPAKRRSREAMEKAALLQSHLVEDISGVETIKSFNLEEPRAEKGEDSLVTFVQSAFSLQKLGITMNAAAAFVSGIAGVVILWYGGHRVMAGAMTLGQLMFFNSVLANMLGPLQSLANTNLSIQDALVAIDRLFQIMEIDTEAEEDNEKVKFTSLKKGISFQKVGFAYGSRDNVLEDLDFTIPAGSTAAIVGESGSGKTTVLKLLARLYDPTQGSILIDGMDSRDYDLPSLRRMIGVVPQEPFIFSGTLKGNISVGASQASMDEISQSTKIAALDGFVAELPRRYETVVGERGANLSGGQKQRLAIARMLLRQPEIMLFDEATSHLDTATEAAIQESLRTVLKEKTVILVAHRLSTVMRADHIFVLQKGRIVEQGKHHELVEKGGYYASLWKSQSSDGAGT